MNDDFNTHSSIDQGSSASWTSSETGFTGDTGVVMAMDELHRQNIELLFEKGIENNDGSLSRSEELNRAYDAFIEASVADRNSASTPILIACVVLAMLCMPLISMIVEWFMK